MRSSTRRVREFVAKHRIESERGALGGALLAFSYDAARPSARLPPRTPSEPVMPAAFVAIPATWLIFDHFTDSLTIWTSAGDAQRLERRIDGYVERLLAARRSSRSRAGEGDDARSRSSAHVTSSSSPA